MPEANRRVADLLQEYGKLLELQGSDRFKTRAYERAARALREHAEDVSTLDARGLQGIPNVGRAIAAKVDEYVKTGSIASLDELREELGPPEVRSLTRIPGLGPKNALRLFKELGVRSREDLLRVLDDGSLRELKGFGAKAEDSLRKGLEREASAERRMLVPDALALAGEALGALREAPGVERADYAGSLRRVTETVGDLDLLAASNDADAAMDVFVSQGFVEEVLERGGTKCSVLDRNGFRIDLRVVPPDVYGAAMQHFTGSKQHNVRLRELALRKGFRLSEYGLERTDGGEVVAAATEEDIYAALGMQWIPPTLREDRGEIDLALRDELPEVLQVRDLRGDLQTHSSYSDGRASLRQMVMAAAERGYKYYAVTDHGQALTFMTPRLMPDAILKQRAEIDELNAELDGRMLVLQGVELNVGPSGELDYPDEILATFDIVVASVHHSLRATKAEMTARILKALQHPAVNIWGHPTNRRLGKRPESEIDLDMCFEAAAANGVAVEIDALPERLDIKDEYIFRARSKGCVFTVDSDGHSPGELAGIALGVATAQRGWVVPSEVVNTWPRQRVLEFLRKGR